MRGRGRGKTHSLYAEAIPVGLTYAVLRAFLTGGGGGGAQVGTLIITTNT